MKTLSGSAFSVFARCSSAIQTHWALRVRKPLQTFSELIEVERFDYFLDPIVANSVYKSLQLSSHHFYSAVAIWTLTAENAAYPVLITGAHFKPSVKTVGDSIQIRVASSSKSTSLSLKSVCEASLSARVQRLNSQFLLLKRGECFEYGKCQEETND